MIPSKFIKEFEVRTGRKLPDKEAGALAELLDRYNVLAKVDDSTVTELMEDFDFESDTVAEDIEEKTCRLDTISTDIVSPNTVVICPKCGVHNHLTDGSCIRCDRHLI